MTVAIQYIDKFLHCLPRWSQQNHIICISYDIQSQTSNVASYPAYINGLIEIVNISGEYIIKGDSIPPCLNTLQRQTDFSGCQYRVR